MNADLFEKIQKQKIEEKSIGAALKQTGQEALQYGRDRIQQVQDEGLGSTLKTVGKDAANHALNGGLVGEVVSNATEDSTSTAGQLAHNITSKERNTASDFNGAVAGRAGVALTAVAAPTLAKYGINLAKDKMDGFLGELFNVFESSNNQQQQTQQAQSADTNLRLDIKNILQKAKTVNSKYSKNLETVLGPLINKNK